MGLTMISSKILLHKPPTKNAMYDVPPSEYLTFLSICDLYIQSANNPKGICKTNITRIDHTAIFLMIKFISSLA